MAKDDYFVLVYRILDYLYDCIRGRKKLELEYLQPMTEDFPIEADYFSYIMENMCKSGYIEGIVLLPIIGSPQMKIKYTHGLRITPAGIAYLQDNSAMSRAKEFLKTLKETVPGL